MTEPAVCASDVCFASPIYTGKERDSESGNDYFGARYYASSMGRWLSPDWSAKATPVPYAKMDNPQSLNLYAYVGNNPMTGRDLDGHVCIFGIGNTCTPPPPPLPKPPDPANVGSGSKPATPAANKPSLIHGGIGVQVGGDAALGLGKGGVATAGAGAGVFVGGKDTVSAGAYASGGAAENVTSPTKGAPTQDDKATTVVGGGAGAGGGIFITNASSASQLSGPFTTFGADASFGEVGLGVQLSTGNDSSGNSIWQLSVSYSVGAEAAGYVLTTNTVTASTDSH